jgi:hypothetical protein
MQLIHDLKEAGQDFEFYPTTAEIIGALVRDMAKQNDEIRYSRRHQGKGSLDSILDVGAGNGKVLKSIRATMENRNSKAESYDRLHISNYYAIEKSPLLCGQLDESIFIIGTDFHEQTLISKTADVLFSNPPYSEFEAWAVKIIRECAGVLVYLVIPERWENSLPIADALAFRGVKAHIVGRYDFANSEDRTARAKVHLLRIDYADTKETAFERTFREEFAAFIATFGKSPKGKKAAWGDDDEDEPKAAPTGKGRFASLVVGENYPSALVALYNEDMAKVYRNYQAAAQLDADLLREFDIDPARIMGCLKERLTGLRQLYWHELFERMRPITERLTSKSRDALLSQLKANVNVDFTTSNIHAVIVWALKNANRFIDSQLVGVYENMIDKCNVKLYKSNKRAFVDGWRHEETGNSHYLLDYRIVTHRVGGTCSESWRGESGLEKRAFEFISDLLTIAGNLNFATTDLWALSYEDWKPGEAREFAYLTPKKTRETLVEVRAFKNGNLHLKLNQKFILALNVEHGRIKGWLKNPMEAAEELQDPQAAAVFQSNYQLAAGQTHNLLAA